MCLIFCIKAVISLFHTSLLQLSTTSEFYEDIIRHLYTSLWSYCTIPFNTEAYRFGLNTGCSTRSCFSPLEALLLIMLKNNFAIWCCMRHHKVAHGLTMSLYYGSTGAPHAFIQPLCTSLLCAWGERPFCRVYELCTLTYASNHPIYHKLETGFPALLPSKKLLFTVVPIKSFAFLLFRQ